MTSEEANSIPLGSILSRYGHEPARRYGGYDMYSSPFRRDSSPSFKVFRDANRWIDFGDGSHGRAVDLVMRLENCPFQQAMRLLGDLGLGGPAAGASSLHRPPSGTASARPSSSGMTILKVIPVENRYLLDYAASRGIDADIVRSHCVEVHYCFERNPREKYALGFANDRKGFELRNSMFKGCANAKDITCIAGGNRACAVFEGFFDLLSFKQYAKEHPEIPGLGRLDVCVLNSTAMAERSKDFLSRYEKVHAFLDNDPPGREALRKIRSLLPEGTVVVNESERLFPGCNDFNAFLQKARLPASGREM